MSVSAKARRAARCRRRVRTVLLTANAAWRAARRRRVRLRRAVCRRGTHELSTSQRRARTRQHHKFYLSCALVSRPRTPWFRALLTRPSHPHQGFPFCLLPAASVAACSLEPHPLSEAGCLISDHSTEPTAQSPPGRSFHSQLPRPDRQLRATCKVPNCVSLLLTQRSWRGEKKRGSFDSKACKKAWQHEPSSKGLFSV